MAFQKEETVNKHIFKRETYACINLTVNKSKCI